MFVKIASYFLEDTVSNSGSLIFYVIKLYLISLW